MLKESWDMITNLAFFFVYYFLALIIFLFGPEEVCEVEKDYY